MIYKRGKYYWFKFQWKGRILYFSTGQGDARVATNLESKKRIELAEARGGIKRKKDIPTLRAYLHDTIIPWAEAQFTAVPKSLKWYRNESRVLCDYKPLADAKLDEINGSLLTGFKSWRLKQGKAINTVNSTIRALRAVLSHGVEDGLIDVAPKLKQLKGAKKREYVLPAELEQAYLDACTEPLRTVAVLMLDAGMRPAEIYSLRWNQVRFDARHPAIAVKGTKTAAAIRNVPMTLRVRDILTTRWNDRGKPLDGFVFPAKRRLNDHIIDNTVMEPHWNAVKKSGITTKDFKLYCLRHTCLTRWGEKGMDAWSLAYLAGHSSIRQSMTYVHPSASTTERAFQAPGGDEIRDNGETPVLDAQSRLLVASIEQKS
jgi:integrase